MKCKNRVFGAFNFLAQILTMQKQMRLILYRNIRFLTLTFALSLLSLLFVAPYTNAIDMVENSWSIMNPMPTPRAGIGAAVVNGKIYVIGGSYDSHGEVEEYDPATNTWTKKTPMPTPRIYFGIAALGNKIYTIGGDSGNWEVGERITNVVEVYDPLTDTWETKSSMPTKRKGLSASVVNGKIYVIGGRVGEPTYNPLPLTEVYDPETDTWTTAAPIPVPSAITLL